MPRKRRSVYTPYMYGDYQEHDDSTAEEAGRVPGVENEEVDEIDTFSVSVSNPGMDQRQVIEIVFKLIGEF